MAQDCEVVITGLGVVSPIGVGRDAFADALMRGQNGVAPLQQHDASALPVQFGAELKDFQPKLHVKPRKSLKVMSREIQAGVASAVLAVEDARLPVEDLDCQRFGVIYGSPMLYSELEDLSDAYRASLQNGSFDFDAWGEQFTKQMQPLWMLKYLPNMMASHVGIAHDARGANNSIVMGDVSSLLAIIEATTVIQRGWCDVILTGGGGSRLSLTGIIYRSHCDLSRHSIPGQACRPFDAQRDGMVLGEGAATFVLESRAHAEQRGATIYGRVLGYASTHAGTLTSAVPQTPEDNPMVRAIQRSIEGCLAKAGLDRSDGLAVGQVNAHGLSDPLFDQWEAGAIAATVGTTLPVTALKSYFGNVGAGSGALELAASLCCNDTVLPTLNYEHADPACNVSVSAAPQAPQGSTILKLNQATTGQAVALLVDTSD